MKAGGDRQSKKALSKDSIMVSDLDITTDESSDSQLRGQINDRDFQAGIELKRKRRRR